jgi:hypothetical protein
LMYKHIEGLKHLIDQKEFPDELGVFTQVSNELNMILTDSIKA